MMPVNISVELEAVRALRKDRGVGVMLPCRDSVKSLCEERENPPVAFVVSDERLGGGPADPVTPYDEVQRIEREALEYGFSVVFRCGKLWNPENIFNIISDFRKSERTRAWITMRASYGVNPIAVEKCCKYGVGLLVEDDLQDELRRRYFRMNWMFDLTDAPEHVALMTDNPWFAESFRDHRPDTQIVLKPNSIPGFAGMFCKELSWVWIP